MHKFFYAKFAATNMNKHRKTYLPYLLSCIATITMFYMMHFISKNDGLLKMEGGSFLIQILHLGNYVIGIFSFIFLFYTNSFLIKQRKKEFGLFNILGMEKKHIARMIFWEQIFVTVICLSVGVLSGIIFSRLMLLFLQYLLHFDVPFTYMISIDSVVMTIILFTSIFIVTLLNNLRQIHLSKPIELLKGGQVGEKEPKTKWLLTLIGCSTLGYGYYIALVTESPLVAFNKFFLAVVLVIIGTYALFTAGTITLLKLLRKNKKFYYQTKHFISVSGMIYRMKQNAVGLANICILSTMVLVMLSTTVSLYVGMEDLLKNRFPKEIDVAVTNVSEKESEQIKQMIHEEAQKYQMRIKEPIQYRSISFPAYRKGNAFITDRESQQITNLALVELIPLEEYNRLENKNITLEDNEVLLFTFRGKPVKNAIVFGEKEFHIKEELEDLTINGDVAAYVMDSYFVIVKDEQIIKDIYPAEELQVPSLSELSYYYGFDVEGDREQEVTFTKALSHKFQDMPNDVLVEGREDSREAFYSIYGGFLFLGIFLGALFIMATVLIMYYKQISEGHDDKKRYAIMQKVGLSKDEIKQSIKSQVLIVFFLPLVAACIHIAFAFNVITQLLELLNLTNVGLFAICTVVTILVFALFYALIYALTAREYYKIVS